ncbi:DUF4235 domain-containing protein [Aeromicrobium sp. SMF47]|uniref:DUF4235 domain-containing protein n=1 Tax=Aeromicrobium yanjiei TaxID=2662028 RepID=A0A5Q2MHN2_9ACTN|nr:MULTISPECIES: DUF4235 domain-containing protein [Aeromicrobium]MRJ77698.1 DUF4235 domain-containing protein [Aeromicrobium yanjiei]MRK02067.1 DUF4235 domain-containing protein [Aeromicrobium sp. S22]QGG41203.1 DUF4235 domain-containing protein [Aeromicrobium yanjiei]
MAKKRKKASLAQEAAKTPNTKAPGRGTWKVMDKGSSVVAGLLAQRASSLAWRTVTGKRPPTSGRHPEVSTREAVAWAMVGGGIIELVKVGVRRGTATYWVKSTGQLPPGMKPLMRAQGDTAPSTTKEPVLAEPAPTHSSTRKVSRRSRGR